MEPMVDFFTERVKLYDRHMLEEVEGCKEGYRRMAQLLPQDCQSLLDLGCGTGLELDEIFKRFPQLRVTGIELTQAMLEELRRKHPDQALTLLCGSYFDVDLGRDYDAAVSFQTLHHFSHGEKLGLYQRLCRALKPSGVYLECDYMVESEEEEALYFRENERLRREQGIPPGAFYHYDTPCTVAHQMELLQKAGFQKVVCRWRQENTTLLTAEK